MKHSVTFFFLRLIYFAYNSAYNPTLYGDAWAHHLPKSDFFFLKFKIFFSMNYDKLKKNIQNSCKKNTFLALPSPEVSKK